MITSGAATTAASIIDLRLSPTTSIQRTETVHHHHHQPCRKLGSHTLNKTDEHCRSLFSLLPTSLRSYHRQTLNKKGIDASTTTQLSPTIDIIGSDCDSDYMSQIFLNRTSSYASCYSSIPTNMPKTNLNRNGSIENLLYGHSKSNPANVRVIVRKNFEPFAQAHIAVRKGTIVTALFSRGPWLYIQIDLTGKTGYIPRIICSLYQNQLLVNNLSISSTDSSLIKDDETKTDKYLNYPSKQQINRYLSHSSAIIDDTKQRLSKLYFDERERRNTYTLPISSRINSSKDRRLTLSSINCPATITKQESSNLTNDIITVITRDTDSSSTQDSGYSDSTPFFLVQQATPENEQSPLYSIINLSKKSNAIPHYATVRRRSSLLKVPDPIKPISQSHIKQTQNHRQTLLNGKSMNDMIINDSTKRHSFGENFNTKISTTNSNRRLPEFALIRNVQRDKTQVQQQQKIKPSINNLPKSHIQIPASIFLNHHRQKQQFGSSHSAFRPVQPTLKHKRASSEGHSPSISTSSSPPLTSSSSSSLSSSNSSINNDCQTSKRRRLSIDLPVPILSELKSNSLTRSVCDQSSSKNLNQFSRTMSDILCDQFSEINIDAIEKDSLVHHHQPKKFHKSQHCLFTILKDYRSSRASFSVKRGDYVYILKQVGRACYLVRKQTNGQIGFIPKALIAPTTSTQVDTFLKMHEYRETII
ncbi:unnamed protein product [Adineta steineri]|uniref:SH3 domain-containing protein n=1 Tax=Adineta steineri TaxID=433720 RepID=A0A814N0V1_9BILA|nr:unnamed protein product [Adineta steineri]CAF1144426.1 unnamed protein product [Adineta steineri]